MNINSRRREQNLTNDADRSCGSHHSPALAGSNGLSLSSASLSTTQRSIRTNRCGCDPIQDPKKGVVRSGLVWFRKSKRNNKPNHKQFIIHCAISELGTPRRRAHLRKRLSHQESSPGGPPEEAFSSRGLSRRPELHRFWVSPTSSQ